LSNKKLLCTEWKKKPPTAEIAHRPNLKPPNPDYNTKLQPARRTLSQFSLKSTLVKKLAKQNVKNKKQKNKKTKKNKNEKRKRNVNFYSCSA